LLQIRGCRSGAIFAPIDPRRRAEYPRGHALSETLRRSPSVQTATPSGMKTWVGSDPINRLTRHLAMS
jgi:hypothetical protein